MASEIGNAHIEACKAQAVVARTYAYPYAQSGKPITDSGSKHQAYRATRYDKCKYPNACNATEQTKGIVLMYNSNVIPTCSYSASNGGRTTSSE